MEQENIVIKGARVNNLKNIDVLVPRNKLVIMTGLSGSGKTSLAFDTIYAEGQRRYVESLSAYARQFLGGIEKPDVDLIEGLSPAVSIDQKTTSNNPRSTVGTVTEIYDFLRLMYARIGTPYCPIHHEPIEATTINQMVEQLMQQPDDARLTIMAPLIKEQKGTHKELFEHLLKEGFVRVRVNGKIRLLEEGIVLEKNKRHNIDVVVDRVVKRADSISRLHDSLETAVKLTAGLAVVQVNNEDILFSQKYACKYCGFSIPNLEPRLFSFNSPLGACARCNGLGFIQQVDLDLLIPDDSKSINQGGIVYYKNLVGSENIDWQTYKVLLDHYQIDLDKPLKDFTPFELDIILNGSKEPISYQITSRSGNSFARTDFIEGVKTLIERRYRETTSSSSREWYGSFLADQICDTCQSSRLNEMALSVKIGQLNIYEWTQMSIKQALKFLAELTLTAEQAVIAKLVLKEIKDRLQFLNNVGLEYLTLDRMAGSLSGGEAQRIRLATQIGSRLSGVLYVLDEPSIGLHQRDNERLILALKNMRDLGNSLIVVEHDEETMWAADYIIDIGPGAGHHGGEVVAVGTPAEVAANTNSITGDYLSGRLSIPVPKKRRKGNGLNLQVVKASENNLKDITVNFPLGTFIVVTGVSGSGKSSLINEVLTKALLAKLGRVKIRPGKYANLIGYEQVDKVVAIDQNPIGRTPRSNPATYTGIFDFIRDLFALTVEAKVRGYDKGRFSFNVRGGRCEHCQGDGVKRISMHFLPDVYVPCEECHGKRYNEETLQVLYKGKNIYDILEMTVEEALIFFAAIPALNHRLQILADVGLDYLKLGQNSTTLSGGEAQRVKLASELQKKATGKTVFVLDEPTTGLHTHDVKKLLTVLERIVENGDTVIVIEHNLDIIKSADYIVDLGPEGGDDGGCLIATGTPEAIAKVPNSYTGQYLKRILK